MSFSVRIKNLKVFEHLPWRDRSAELNRARLCSLEGLLPGSSRSVPFTQNIGGNFCENWVLRNKTTPIRAFSLTNQM